MAIKIFIDQGHNPTNPNSGAEGNGLREQDLTYAIGIILRDLLNANPAYEALSSRNSPTEILGTSNASSLAARVNAANSWGADYFISLHANASVNTDAFGSEAFVYTDSSPAYPLAQSILQSMTNILGTTDRGVSERPSLYVLRKTQMPALLLEMGFITNYNEAINMNNNPGDYAFAIYTGIINYLGS